MEDQTIEIPWGDESGQIIRLDFHQNDKGVIEVLVTSPNNSDENLSRTKILKFHSETERYIDIELHQPKNSGVGVMSIDMNFIIN